MIFPYKIGVVADGIWLMPGDEDDLSSVLALWDETVAWLVAKGIEGQWGTVPFSQLPTMRERFLSWLRKGELFVAREGDASSSRIIGTLALVDTIPGYAMSAWEALPDKGLYLEAFTTAEMWRGTGIGRALLEWAEAYTLEHGETVLRLDCWAENKTLQAYYRVAGFQPCGIFWLASWKGQMFEKRLSNAGSGDGIECRSAWRCRSIRLYMAIYGAGIVLFFATGAPVAKLEAEDAELCRERAEGVTPTRMHIDYVATPGGSR